MNGTQVLYRPYTETRDASGDREIECDDIRITDNYISLRLGKEYDMWHAYGIIRDSAKKVVALQQLQLNEHDGAFSYQHGAPEGIGLQYGEKGDRRTTVCWRADIVKWWWSGGESRRDTFGKCDELIPGGRQKLICVEGDNPPNPCM
jgi:hypothetical protein